MNLPWYPRKVDLWRKSARVTMMSLAARGAYSELLDFAWLQDGCKIPNRPEEFWKFARCTPQEWNEVSTSVLSMFSVIEEGAFLQNDTLLAEWNKAQALSLKRSAIGRKGNEIKYGRKSEPTAQKKPAVADPAKENHRECVRRVFDFYLKKTGRSEATYRLTEPRMSKGLTRLSERIDSNNGDLAAAEADMLRAVEGLTSNDWCMGRDQRTNGKKYCEWDANLMKSEDEFEKRLNAVPAKRPQLVASTPSFAQQQRERKLANAGEPVTPPNGRLN